MTSGHTTEELVERARGGDRGAFDELVRGLEHELHAFVQSRLGPAVRQLVEPDDDPAAAELLPNPVAGTAAGIGL